jgi:hypothetical protein
MRNALSKNPQRLIVQCSEPLAAPRSTIFHDFRTTLAGTRVFASDR